MHVLTLRKTSSCKSGDCPLSMLEYSELRLAVSCLDTYWLSPPLNLFFAHAHVHATEREGGKERGGREGEREREKGGEGRREGVSE